MKVMRWATGQSPVISVTRFCVGAITGDLPPGRVRVTIDDPYRH